jgi:energy-coupling factor transport system permease protein
MTRRQPLNPRDSVSDSRPFHTGAWVAWLAAAAVPAFTLRNPLYLGLVLGAAWIVYSALGRTTLLGSSWGSFVKIGLFFLVVAIPFSALSVHAGQIVLFRLPESWPILGGPITLEATIAGAVNGLSLLTILAIFAAFNAVVDHYQLLRAVPASLFEAGVVVSIAITFVPQMVLSAKEIREAQRIRGYRFRGLRDLLPLVIPLLANGLERAIQLAETMEARGFGSGPELGSSRRATLVQLANLIALLGLLAGLSLVAFWPATAFWGWVLVVVASLGMVALLGLHGRRVQRTRYRRSSWLWRDTAVVVASAVVVTIIVAARLTVPALLTYLPYPPGSLLPPFNPPVGAALLLLVVPALLAPKSVASAARDTEVAP